MACAAKPQGAPGGGIAWGDHEHSRELHERLARGHAVKASAPLGAGGRGPADGRVPRN